VESRFDGEKVDRNDKKGEDIFEDLIRGN